jgi:hypothetical protein
MKLSDTAIKILLMVESAHVRVLWYNAMSPVGMASPERGHGTTSNPRPAVIFKLIDAGLIEGREHADLKLTRRDGTAWRSSTRTAGTS